MERNDELQMVELRVNARFEAGRLACGIIGRADSVDQKTAFNDFKTAYGFLVKEFEAALSGVADPPDNTGEPNV